MRTAGSGRTGHPTVSNLSTTPANHSGGRSDKAALLHFASRISGNVVIGAYGAAAPVGLRRAFTVEQRTGEIDYWMLSEQKQRWLATALLDIEPRLRRVRGHKHLPALRRALQAHKQEKEMERPAKAKRKKAA